MKKLSLSKINNEQLEKKELLKIHGGASNCTCSGPIYPSLSVNMNGGDLQVCNCNDGSDAGGNLLKAYTGALRPD